jgi:gas vesicle protein
MTRSATLLAAALTMTFALAACEKDTPVETAVENTKDALDVRDHEKLKDAAEDVKDAAQDVKEGVKDAADDVKDAVKDPKN